MKLKTIASWLLAGALIVCGGDLTGRPLVAQDSQAESTEGIEVLTRGPVHEAFAGTISFHPEAGVVVPKAPPEPIEELPPEQTLEGDNVAWIPGYWAWDDEREDFLWISGIWRSLPPGRQWVPGYWAEVDGGYQWTSGYWADTTVAEVAYLPEPPASLDQGPNVDAPSADHIWVPGSWVWQDARYMWRPGYWVVGQANWVWIPSYYVWAPRGYVYVGGYWDYAPVRRGILFAPVYLNAGVYGRRGFVYSPTIVINTNVFVDQLFFRPRFHHYYFGDYYASNYASVGFYPWFAVGTRRIGYDPFFAYARWQHRQNGNWARTIQASYKNRVDNEDARPPRTFADQQKRTKSGDAKDKNFAIAAPISEVAKSGDAPVKLRALKEDERKQFAERGQEVRKFRKERQEVEAKAAGDADVKTADQATKEAKEPARLKLPQSPIAAKAAAKAEGDAAPPKAPEQPAVDTKAKPKPRDVARQKGAADDDTPADPKTKPPVRGGRAKTKGETTEAPEPADTPKPKATPKGKGKTAVDPKPEPDPVPDPKPEPKPEPKPKPKADPKPKIDPKPQPKPMPTPKVEPKADPKPAPAPKPKAEPKPMPQPKPVPPPKANPRPDPKPAPKKPERAPKEKPGNQ